jgi:hypothetical protein
MAGTRQIVIPPVNARYFARPMAARDVRRQLRASLLLTTILVGVLGAGIILNLVQTLGTGVHW